MIPKNEPDDVSKWAYIFAILAVIPYIGLVFALLALFKAAPHRSRKAAKVLMMVAGIIFISNTALVLQTMYKEKTTEVPAPAPTPE